MSWRASVLLVAIATAACTDNPNIDGTMVPVLDAAATCTDLCARIAALCGYSPLGGDCTTPDASGYCDTQLSSDQMACMETASSCQEVWDTADGGCAYSPPVSDAGVSDGGSE